MSRKKKLLMNTAAGVLKQLIMMVCSFILPRFMLLYFGSSVNGLVSSMTHFLHFISLLDMGVGAVVQANMYKPLADKDNRSLSMIVRSSERFFRRLACIFLVYIAVLCFVLPAKFADEYDTLYTVSLLLIVSISTMAQYLFGMSYSLLLNADQRSYIQLVIQVGTVILNTVCSVVLMKLGASVHMVKLLSAAIFVLRPLGQMLYVRKHYALDRKVQIVGEPIKQKWNGFSQHFASVISLNIAVVVLTMFSTLENVSVYSVYHRVAYGVQEIILMAAVGLEAMLGNMLAKGESKRLQSAFSAIEWLIHAVVTFAFTVAAITIVPFVKVYTSGITDANYIQPLFGLMLVIAYAIRSLRVPYFRVIKAAGHFKQTQNGAFISAGLNVVITVLLVFRFGLIGVAVGTLMAMAYHTCYFVWYLRKNILNRSPLYFVKYVVVDALTAVGAYFAAQLVHVDVTSYGSWIALAFAAAGITLVVSMVVNMLFCHRQILPYLKKITRKLTRKKAMAK